MNIINGQIVNLAWNMFFILIASSSICFLINGKKQKNRSIQTFILLALILVLNLLLGIIQSVYIYNKFIGLILLSYEIIGWIFIIEAIILNKKSKKIIISKNEKILIAISIFIGTILVIILFLSNMFYVSPMRDNRYIGNYYFNADTHRCIEQMISSNSLTHKIHPLYRFIILPIVLPLIIINELLKGYMYFYYLEIISAYILCFIQIICNAISSVILYKILKHEKVNEKVSIIGTLIFIFSISIFWSNILPETYAITTLTLLMFIYLYLKKNKYNIFFAVLSIGANIITIVPIGIILFWEIIKNRRKLNKFLPLIIVVFLLIGILAIPYLADYVVEWMYKNKSISETFIDSINYFLIPLLYGPNFSNIGSLLVQINTFNPILLVWIFFFILAVVGYITNFKRVTSNICILYLIVAYFLHVIFGYGFVNGILYSPLYCWPFILLISFGINYIYHKINKKKIFIALILTLTSSVLIYNFIWIAKISNNLKEEKFNIITNANNGLYKYLKNGNYYETFTIYNDAIYRCGDGKEIVSNIDQYIQNDNCLTGLLKDSNWFKIYFENGKLKLNISNKIQTIEKDQFYIFGMGLRKKFILTKTNNQKFKLIEYESGKEILTDLIVNEFDYKNYTVYCNNDISIFENEYGIFVKTNNKIKTLDDSTYINIPNFKDYEHAEQLKILFNEVMINITEDGPKPNFIAYDEVWYRDAAIVAKVLLETNNLKQINNWINNIDKIYDEQNGVKEPDNLGQVLYLISLGKNKNKKLIKQVMDEAEKLKTDEGYIEGITDGSKHPVYQTKWLIYGMNELGLDSSEYKIPDISDSYSDLLWFDKKSHKIKDINSTNFNDRWQYLYFAKLHYNKIRIDYKNTSYPISNEILPSKPNFKKLNLINNNLSNSYIVTPHSWSASEMFLYLLDLDKENV